MISLVGLKNESYPMAGINPYSKATPPSTIHDTEWYGIKREDVINFVPQNEAELDSLRLLLCAYKDWSVSIENVLRLRKLRQIMMLNYDYREPVLVPGHGMERTP